MKKVIYIFGNPLLGFDSLPIKFQQKLSSVFPGIDFKIIDPNENLKPINKELVLIDTVEGIKGVKVIDDLNVIIDSPKYSPHDLDLGFNIKLLQKLGKLKRVLIFGVPMEGDEKEIYSSLIRTLKKWEAQDMQGS